MATQNSTTDSTRSNRRRSYIERWKENGAWHATEPNSDENVEGRGQTEIAAVRNYLDLLEESEPDGDSDAE